MHHETLGEITIDGDNGIAIVSYDGRMVEIRIITDDVPYSQSIDLAAAVVTQLAALDATAKHVAAAGLTETYNSSWSEYDEVQEDGTLETVVNPQLTEIEFANKLSLRSINVTGGAMLKIFYDDENMFWGHSVVVTSFNGIEFTDTYTEIFG